jgi:hypothetical protein
MELPVRWKWKLNRLRERINAFFAPREEEAPRPKLCPACNTLVGATQSHCHECGASMTFSLAAASKTLRRWMPQENPASYSILALSAFLYTMGLMGTVAQQDQAPQLSGGLFGLFGILRVDSHILYRMGMSLPLPYNIAQPWRFITATFLHLSLIHIFFQYVFVVGFRAYGGRDVWFGPLPFHLCGDWNRWVPACQHVQFLCCGRIMRCGWPRRLATWHEQWTPRWKRGRAS